MMLKRILISATILMCALGNVYAADLKIGVFDEKLVLSKIPQVNLIESNLQSQFKDRSEELKALGNSAMKQQEDFRRDTMTMTDSQRIEKQREIQQLRSDYKLKESNLNDDFKRAQQEEVYKVRIKIQQTVDKLATAEKFDLILRTEAVAFRIEAMDISNKLITILSNPAG